MRIFVEEDRFEVVDMPNSAPGTPRKNKIGHKKVCRVWCSTVAWYGVVLWHGMVWYGMVWYGMVWYDSIVW